MSGLLRYATLTVKAKTGLGAAVAGWAVIVVLCAAAMLLFLLFAAFIWLAERYSPLSAAMILATVLLLMAIMAGIVCVAAQRRNVEVAKRAIEAQSATRLLHPKFLGIGLQIGRAIGWQKLISLAAVGILAAGLAWEWSGKPHQDG
jgi:hypothetical protein